MYCTANYNWVLKDRLALGDAESASDIATLRKNRIQAIITARNTLSRDDYGKHKIDILHLPLSDHHNSNIGKYFVPMWDFVERHMKQGHRVLIHCKAGISRSVTLVLAYLMRKCHLRLPQALEMIRNVRQCANPNPGFLQQLQVYESILEKFGYYK